MTKVWKTGDLLDAAHMNDLAQISDVGTPGTPTGDALKAAFDAFGSALRYSPDRAPLGPQPTMVAQANTAGHGWTNGGTTGAAVSNLNDTSDTTFGSQCITLTTTGTGTDHAGATKVFGSSLDVTGKQPVLWVKCDDITKLQNIELRLGDGAFANFFYMEMEGSTVFAKANRWLRSGKWTRLTLPWGSMGASTGTPSRSTLAQVRVTVNDNGTGPCVLHLAGFGIQPEPSVAYCSFTLDDGWGDQWNIHRPILDSYGWAATALPIVDLLGTGQGTYMTLQNLLDLQNVHNWEIGAHAFTNAAHSGTGGLTALTAAQLDAELSSLKAWLVTNGFRGRDYFAYPQGLHNDTVINGVRTYFAAARTQLQYGRETLPVADLYRTRTVNLGSGMSLATAQGFVDEAVANKEWINFTSHKLGATQADGSTWVTSDFQALCAYIAGKGSALLVRTYGQVLRSVAP